MTNPAWHRSDTYNVWRISHGISLIPISDLWHVRYSSHIICHAWDYTPAPAFCHVQDSSHIITIWPLSCVRFVTHYFFTCKIRHTLLVSADLCHVRFVIHYKYLTFDMCDIRHTLFPMCYSSHIRSTRNSSHIIDIRLMSCEIHHTL